MVEKALTRAELLERWESGQVPWVERSWRLFQNPDGRVNEGLEAVRPIFRLMVIHWMEQRGEPTDPEQVDRSVEGLGLLFNMAVASVFALLDTGFEGAGKEGHEATP